MNKHVRVIYSGRVQGVGFRYTARDIARALRVAGWVANASDGTVELRAEADEVVLREFLDEIASHFSRYIRDARQEWAPAQGAYDDFQIRF